MHLTGVEGLQLTLYHGLVTLSCLLRARAPALCGHRGNSLVGTVTVQCLPKTQTPHSPDHFVCPQKSYCTNHKIRKGKFFQFPPDNSRRQKGGYTGGKPVSMVCSQKIATILSISASLCGCGSRIKAWSSSVSESGKMMCLYSNSSQKSNNEIHILYPIFLLYRIQRYGEVVLKITELPKSDSSVSQQTSKVRN